MARAEESRGLRDEANVGPDPRRARELRPLKELNWKVADGEPDVRGWSVYASTGRELGVVDDLLVDMEAGEVVLIDVDLKRDDRHTLAPLRAAWIDRATKRVVVDAKELGAPDAVGAVGAADTAPALPALPRRGTLSDADVTRFNDDYVRAYGDRGYDADQAYRLRRGDEELRFGARSAPRRLMNESTALGATGAAAIGAASVGGAHASPRGELDAASDEGKAINRQLADLPRDRPVAREDVAADARRRDAEVRDAELSDAVTADAARRDREHAQDRRDSADRRAESLGDASTEDPMLAERAIDPRELDARVRIDEGATVDESTPVGGVRYDSESYPRHSYGRVEDQSDRDDRIVSRRPWVDEATANAPDAGAEHAADTERRVYYRRANDEQR